MHSPFLNRERFTLFGSVRHHAVTHLVSSAVNAVGSILGGSAPSDAPVLPAPVAQPAVPTVDSATVAQNMADQSAQAEGQKKGSIATLLNTGTTQTGDELGSGSPETTLKRFLG